jgi:acyl carrier protein phosphodiesterase
MESTLDLDTLIKEGKEYIELKGKCRLARNPTAGSPSYLISKEWLTKYKKFVFVQEIKKHMKPILPAAHS